ncbi:hypothetical protein M1271_02280 [Patescibacteria group bacterium]|nr:hypothetical protein [Patescibacteria group bacterium]MCL5798360.1 hypothetical protein [Patescibacteria group bacterium]
MMMKVSAPVTVSLIYNHRTNSVSPQVILWEGRKYIVSKVGLHHVVRRGRTLYHVFSVETADLFFRLVLDTDNLHWIVEEIANGEPG